MYDTNKCENIRWFGLGFNYFGRQVRVQYENLYYTLAAKDPKQLFRVLRETTGDNDRPTDFGSQDPSPERETTGDKDRPTDVGLGDAFTRQKKDIRPLQTSCLRKTWQQTETQAFPHGSTLGPRFFAAHARPLERAAKTQGPRGGAMRPYGPRFLD